MDARAYWKPIVTHPDVEPMVFAGMATLDDFLGWLEQDDVTEERYEGGGIVYVDKGDVEELHIAFLPEFWGRPVVMAVRSSFVEKMRRGTTVILREQEGFFRTRPPLSHGWKPLEDYEPSIFNHRTRRWILTPEAWYSSAVGRKMQ